MTTHATQAQATAAANELDRTATDRHNTYVVSATPDGQFEVKTVDEGFTAARAAIAQATDEEPGCAPHIDGVDDEEFLDWIDSVADPSMLRNAAWKLFVRLGIVDEPAHLRTFFETLKREVA